MSATGKAVVTSIEDAFRERCVDIIAQVDGTFVFKEFRRDAEDAGRWTLVADYGGITYPSFAAAHSAAIERVAWLAAEAPTIPKP